MCTAEEKEIHVILKCSGAQKMYNTNLEKKYLKFIRINSKNNWFIETKKLRNLGIFSYEVRYQLETYLKKKIGGEEDDIKCLQILGNIKTGVESESEC